MAALSAGLALAPPAYTADNGLSLTPPMGWSSWSALQTAVDENTVKSIAQVQATVLKSAGYVYVNVDGGWYLDPDADIDSNGRWIADPKKFPSGIQSLATYVHSLGLKLGLYVTPGIPRLAVTRRTPVEGTGYNAADIAITSRNEVTYLGGTMYSIDYRKPGAQEYVNSWANLFAAWGVDYVKLDAIRNHNVADVRAWSAALMQTGLPIHLELANDLDPGYSDIWRQYANGWRISTDIEAYNGVTLTTWDHVALRFSLVPNWLRVAGPGGWNDLDSLLVVGDRTGLTYDERQTMVTFWALAGSPLIIGDDLRLLDQQSARLLINLEVLRINQSGAIASPLSTGSTQQVWHALQPDGTYAVGLFNLGNTAATVDVRWSSLGFSGPGSVRDLWSSLELGAFADSFSTQVAPHASKLLRVTPQTAVFRRLVETAIPAGGAWIGSSTVGAGGLRSRYVGMGGTLTFLRVEVPRTGRYALTINYANGDQNPRSATVTVNGTAYSGLIFPGGGDWEKNLTQQGVTASISMLRGSNTVVLSNPSGNVPDIIAITAQPMEPL